MATHFPLDVKILLRRSGQCKIVLSRFIIFFQCIQDDPEMFFISQEVGIGGIYEKCFDVVLPDIAGIGFLQSEKIIVRNRLFINPVPFPDIFLKLTHRCVQIDEEVRLNQLLVNDVKQLLVEIEFFIGKIHLGKEQAFAEHIIGYGYALEKVFGMNEFL